MSKRIVIVGGVAAGASAAAKARRMSEDIEIVLFEAGPYVSFANCGLPYYVGGEIDKRGSLFVTTAEQIAARFHIDVRTDTTVTGIDRRRKGVTFRGADGKEEELSYDRLILATGTVPVRPPIRGLGRTNVFTVRTVPDVDEITRYLVRHSAVERAEDAAEIAEEVPARALIIGGGYIGLETAEQLLRRGLKVTVVEVASQLILTLDAEIAEHVRASLASAGCEVILGDGVKEIVETDGRSVAVTLSGRELPFDVGILAAGVRPNVALAKAAGIELGETGAIRVEANQRTSDPAIFAAGDNSEAMHLVLGRPANIPLAGPANKAGRAAGANAAMDLMDVPVDDPSRPRLRGVLGTAILRVCGVAAGVTGLTEAQARREGIDPEVLYMLGLSHAGYFPGAERLYVKILYRRDDGRLLGGQVVGKIGVDKRIDVLATAITAGMTVEDLEQLDLCYAPPFGSARDVLNTAGFSAANTRRGLTPTATPAELFEELSGENPPMLVDTRSEREFAAGHLEGAVNVPVDELRGRIDEVPPDRPVVVYCGTGYRSYVAQRILMNHGRTNVRNLQGGYSLMQHAQVLRNPPGEVQVDARARRVVSFARGGSA